MRDGPIPFSFFYASVCQISEHIFFLNVGSRIPCSYWHLLLGIKVRVLFLLLFYFVLKLFRIYVCLRNSGMGLLTGTQRSMSEVQRSL